MKVFERVYKAVSDIINMPSELNALAKEFGSEGYRVERGIAGTVILQLDDGQIHYYPRDNTIVQAAFSN